MVGRALTLSLIAAALAASAAAAPAPGPAELLARADARLGANAVAFPDRPRPESDRTLSPYFVVRGEGGGETERLPLEETRASVRIAGVLAQVTVTQTFRNSGRRPIEAVYVFPASTRAAVHGMRIRIGERTVEARIARRAEARAEYEAARQDGKRAALLEEERPNVFTMSVANVMPGDRLVAELEYSELVVPEGGVYELVYPAVVGPRYGGGADAAKDGWIESPYLHAGEAAPYRFGFEARLETAIPLRAIDSPSHRLDVRYGSPSSAAVTLADAGGGDRDVVLRWRLAGDQVDAGVLLHPTGDGGGFFLAQVEPPARVRDAELPPREYVFVLDVSGSMHGFPLDTAKALLRSLLPRLRPSDSFNVVFFSGGSFVLSPQRSLAATPQNVQRALATFDSLGGGGGTELLAALRTAYALPRADRRTARSVVVVTDGYVGVEAQAFRFVRERLDEASCFAFGIGSSVNRGLLEALARAGQGEPAIVLSPERARAAADRFQALIERPVLSHLAVRFDGLDARDVAPGHLPDLLAERPVVVFGRYEGAPRGRIVLTGQSAAGPFERVLEVGPAAVRPGNAPLRVLWARRWVELLDDEHHLAPAPELEEAIAQLGLGHRILTRFTSFVAVDSEVVNGGGGAERVAQPLPMPAGVSDLAVGGVAAKSVAPAMGFLSSAAPTRARRMEGRADAAVAQAPSAPPPPSSSPAEQERKAGPVPAPAAVVVAERAAGLTDAPALRDAVLRALQPPLRAGVRGTFTLTLHVGADGRVTKVEVGAAADDVRRELVKRLTGLASAARPAAGGPATLVLTVRLG